MTDEDIKSLARFDQLQLLQAILGQIITNEGVQELAKNKGLLYLDLDAERVTDRGVKSLAVPTRTSAL